MDCIEEYQDLAMAIVSSAILDYKNSVKKWFKYNRKWQKLISPDVPPRKMDVDERNSITQEINYRERIRGSGHTNMRIRADRIELEMLMVNQEKVMYDVETFFLGGWFEAIAELFDGERLLSELRLELKKAGYDIWD